MAHGAKAPCAKVRLWSGTINRSSKKSSIPKPSQIGQAPKGALKEKSRGSISDIVNPETGQANFSEKVMRLTSVTSSSPPSRAASKIAMPSARLSAVRKLSARRVSMPARTTIRSTTTSILWRRFFSSVGTSSNS